MRWGRKGGNFPFFILLVIFCFSVYTTNKISQGGTANSGARAAQNDLCKIKENNKHVRGIWTSAVTQALTRRLLHFSQIKALLPRLTLDKAKSTFILPERAKTLTSAWSQWQYISRDAWNNCATHVAGRPCFHTPPLNCKTTKIPVFPILSFSL